MAFTIDGKRPTEVYLTDTYITSRFTKGNTLYIWGNNSASATEGNNTLRINAVPRLVYNNDIYQSAVKIDIENDTCGLLTNTGQLFVWGVNGGGQYGRSTITTINTISWTWGNWGAYEISDFSISTNYIHVIKTDGTLWGAGYNDYGNLGNNTVTWFSSPVQVGTSGSWKSIDGKYYTRIALKTDGSLWTWGNNNMGQLGLGDVNPRMTPTRVGTSNDWCYAVNGENGVTQAIKTDGSLWEWGHLVDGLYEGTTNRVSSPIQVQQGYKWKTVKGNLGITEDGRLFDSLSGVLYEVGGNDWVSCHSTANGQKSALKSDGSLWSWGDNSTYKLGYGSKTTYPTPTKVLDNVKSYRIPDYGYTSGAITLNPLLKY